ncbi:pyridoxamine 5'-phosphate oxidase family protein [Sabulilitoribacter multivorans]|uniref:Pyridoxamine 5'-phosphate oxidase family protein n=1 Tax=Flaviramulus multivorans TaxID=1304750 RepID=A0ABS9IL42_9FLAO|nr:pyridoxamine 5'-phosphate oxidase family protein [Flaviramulus multivorans]MCF7561328.1 pyridoxamine 5'-phosphate oxidase family protein [Flaviramulus multivorans]
MIQNLEKKECEFILKHNYVGHLAYIYGNAPFLIPITYYYSNNKIICYSGEGHKINAMRMHPDVALEVAEIDTINHWQSVVVHGKYEELEGSTARAMLHEFSLGIKDIVMKKERKDLNFISEFSAKIDKDDIPIIFQINIKEMTGKMRRKN